MGRDAAIASYKEYLAKSEDLQGRLRGLSGKTLVCHCGDLDRCHGDTIHRGIRDGSGEAEQGRERFVGGGLGLRQRLAAAQESRERATSQSSSQRRVA